jgi:hypothetical protein
MGAEPRVVDGVHDGNEHGRGGRGEPARGGPEAVHQPEGERDEVVGDLLLGDLVRAQPDDRQDAEQAQAEADPGLGAGEQGGDGEHADVEGGVGQQQVAALVASEVDGVGEHGDGGQVGGDHGWQRQRGWHGRHSLSSRSAPSVPAGGEPAMSGR